MVTRHDIENQVIQRNIERRLEEISKSLLRLVRAATEKGIHEGFLDRDQEDALAEKRRER